MKAKIRAKEASRKEFCVALQKLKMEAQRLGMMKTFRALDRATDEAGWELATLMAQDLKPLDGKR